MHRAIIFDFFDVIHADTFNGWMKNHGFSREGNQAMASADLDRGTIDMPEFFHRLGKVSGQTSEEVAEEFASYEKLNTAMVGFIDKLRQHYTIAVLSNSASDYIRGVIDKHDLEDLFHEVIVSSEVGLIKPEPAIFEHALQKLGVTADEVVFVDDNPNNVVAAGKVGIKGVVFTGVDKLRDDLQTLGIKTD